MQRVTLIRHGQASFGAPVYDQLSNLGQQQARLLGQWLQHMSKPIDGLAHGTLQRQRETAEWLKPHLPLSNRVWQFSWLDEVDMQQLVNCYGASISQPEGGDDYTRWVARVRQVFQLWREQPKAGVESFVEFTERVEQGFTGLRQQCSGCQSLALVTSGGVIALLLLRLTERPLCDLIDVALPLYNTGVTELFWNSGRWQVTTCNQISHLQSSANQAAQHLVTRI